MVDRDRRAYELNRQLLILMLEIIADERKWDEESVLETAEYLLKAKTGRSKKEARHLTKAYNAVYARCLWAGIKPWKSPAMAKLAEAVTRQTRILYK